MALPERVVVKYTEEEAEYVSVRPVVRQTFRLEELLDMLLSITGKDVARLQHILRSGTAVYNFYRYWWAGFEADAQELEAALARFPEADRSRVFRREACVAVLLESDEAARRAPVELEREAASRKRWFRKDSVWDCLMSLTEAHPLAYQTYSYARHGDLYQLELTPQMAETLGREAARLARRELWAHLGQLRRARRIVFLCRR